MFVLPADVEHALASMARLIFSAAATRERMPALVTAHFAAQYDEAAKALRAALRRCVDPPPRSATKRRQSALAIAVGRLAADEDWRIACGVGAPGCVAAALRRRPAFCTLLLESLRAKNAAPSPHQQFDSVDDLAAMVECTLTGRPYPSAVPPATDAQQASAQFQARVLRRLQRQQLGRVHRLIQGGVDQSSTGADEGSQVAPSLIYPTGPHVPCDRDAGAPNASARPSPSEVAGLHVAVLLQDMRVGFIAACIAHALHVPSATAGPGGTKGDSEAARREVIRVVRRGFWESASAATFPLTDETILVMEAQSARVLLQDASAQADALVRAPDPPTLEAAYWMSAEVAWLERDGGRDRVRDAYFSVAPAAAEIQPTADAQRRGRNAIVRAQACLRRRICMLRTIAPSARRAQQQADACFGVLTALTRDLDLGCAATQAAVAQSAACDWALSCELEEGRLLHWIDAEPAAFAQQWRAWETAMRHHVLHEVQLDPTRWRRIPAPPPGGGLAGLPPPSPSHSAHATADHQQEHQVLYLDLQTGRVQAEHPHKAQIFAIRQRQQLHAARARETAMQQVQQRLAALGEMRTDPTGELAQRMGEAVAQMLLF